MNFPQTDVSGRPESKESNAENRVVLRCKSEKGQSVLVLTGASTLDDLVTEVVASTGINREVLILRSGYPPKRINLSPENGQLTLSEVSLVFLRLSSLDFMYSVVQAIQFFISATLIIKLGDME